MKEHRDGEHGLKAHGDTQKTTFTNGLGGKKGNGPLIVNSGGRAQMKASMKLAEETWGGLWAVEAEDLPKFTNQRMPIITEDE
eukprot:7327528-Heterocapsa_arctica.AAC.1